MSNEYKIKLIKDSLSKTQIDWDDNDWDILMEEEGFPEFVDAMCHSMDLYLKNGGKEPVELNRESKHFKDDGAYED